MEAVARIAGLQPVDFDRKIPTPDGVSYGIREVLWNKLLLQAVHHRGQSTPFNLAPRSRVRFADHISTALICMLMAIEEEHVVVDTDKRRLDLEVIHGFLSTSYWSPGIPRDTVHRAIDNSLCFGAYLDGRQVGFARVITDLATFAYVADVFVTPAFRGRGVSKRLMDAIVAHRDLQGLRRWMLATHDAHTLYSRYGFTSLASADQFMELYNPNVYQK